LVGADGRATRVVAATEVMTGRPCYQVVFSDGTVIVADAEHQWRTTSLAATRRRRVVTAGGTALLERVTVEQVCTTAQLAATLRAPDGRLRHQVCRAGVAARHVVDVRPARSVPVRCVQVDNDDHMYLAGAGLVPTHNSTLALDFARSAAVRYNKPTVIFSLEMGRLEIMMRLLSAESSVPLASMRSGHMTDQDWARMARRSGELAEAPLFIDDSANLTMMEIRAKSRRLKQRHDLQLIVIDYLQLMTSGKRVESRQTEVSDFSRSIKLLAKELDVPVVALSQLNRGPEQRTDKKPMLSDLRESGSIEQDSDMVLLVHREDMYEPESPRAGEADLILAKHRNGPTGVVAVAFQGRYSRFSDMPQ
jgi:replicative DNA helicase